jgi:hypothetical protein
MRAVSTWVATTPIGLLSELTQAVGNTDSRQNISDTAPADHAPRLPDVGLAGTELTAEAVDSSVDTVVETFAGMTVGAPTFDAWL